LPAVLALAAAATAPFSSVQARVLGITPDSEYLIFIVDSSGSMRRYEWDRVKAIVRDTLEMYPSIRGFQVINDEGDHLLLSYRGEWIPVTPTNLAWTLEELDNWEAYSTSNPRRGLLSAFDRYYDPDKAIALFVLSDDFSSGAAAIDGVVADVEARNRVRTDDVPRVRIHTVAFPVYFDQLGAARFVNSTGADLAKLMATLSRRNDGSFVGLPSKRAVGAAAEASEAQGLPATETRRVLIVVDASANMLEPYWRQAVDGVEWLLAETGEGDSFQVMTLTAGAQTVVADTEGRWLGGEDDSLRERVVADMRDMTPAGAVVDLGAVPGIVRGFDPAPDEVYLLAASDPSLGRASLPAVGIASPGGAGIDVLLFGAGDNPEVVPHYWALALDGGGSLVAPAGDWP
jgi:hypothetical protein